MIFLQTLLLFLLALPALSGAHTGTLVVSYQTGPERERLDRIRFRLTDERSNTRFYPLGNDFGNDSDYTNHLVVVDDLCPGNYILEFLVPNTDGLFDETPKRLVTVQSGECVKIDQYFHPHYAQVKASAVQGKTASPFVCIPKLTLYDRFHSEILQTDQGELLFRNLIPGSYVLEFEELPGYITPEPIKFTVKPNEEAGPFIGIYECGMDQINPNFDSQPAAIDHSCTTC